MFHFIVLLIVVDDSGFASVLVHEAQHEAAASHVACTNLRYLPPEIVQPRTEAGTRAAPGTKRLKMIHLFD